MEKLDHSMVLQKLCKSTKKWGCFFSLINEDFTKSTEIVKAAPWLSLDNDLDCQMICDESGYVLFDSEEECHLIYDKTVGDDGPKKLNPYNGPARIYMLTCNPDGELMNENT